MKALVVLAIEKTLLDIGKPVYERVIHDLYKKYDCYIPDCFEKPERLKVILKDLYGASYAEIIVSIKQKLDEFTNNERIEEFLQVL